MNVSAASIHAQITGMTFMKDAVFSKDGKEWYIPSSQDVRVERLTRRQEKNKAKARAKRKAHRSKKRR